MLNAEYYTISRYAALVTSELKLSKNFLNKLPVWEALAEEHVRFLVLVLNLFDNNAVIYSEYES
jgi:hypothetical protein